jgi:prenyltransferase beta subunit
VSLLLTLALQQVPQEGEEPPLSLRVNRAIALGVDYLKGQQRPDGSFPGHEGDHPGGTTALVAFALSESGLRRNDEALQQALRALEGNEFRSTYSAAVHLFLCESLGELGPRRAAAERSLAFLLEHQEGGVWAYPGRHPCNSNTQFALLALRAAARLGLALPEQHVLAAAEGLWAFQHRSGGFLYEIDAGEPYAGITAAALASLAVLDELAAGSTRAQSALQKHQRDRAAAERWLERRFDLTRNAYEDGSWTPFWHHAYMWAVERWCGLTGRERFAGRDWYAEGAGWLVDTQARDGSWTSDDKPLENTCFALLFLRRATVSPNEELAEIYAAIDRLRSGRAERHERPGTESLRLTEWMLAGPWTAGGDDVLLLDPPFEPARVAPRARTKLARREWERVALKSDGWTDLDQLTGRARDRALWALATWLCWTPPAGQAGELEALLWLELEDGWDVWLDGQRLSRERRRGAAINGDVKLPLRLAPGTHPLLVLVEDVGGAAAFGARLSDVDNRAPPVGLAASAEQPEDRKR